MDITESFRRILEEKQAITHRFFAVAQSRSQEPHLVSPERDWADQQVDLASLPQTSNAVLALYEEFTSDLLQTLRELHGPEWDPELHEQWRGAITSAGRSLFTPAQELVES